MGSDYIGSYKTFDEAKQSTFNDEQMSLTPIQQCVMTKVDIVETDIGLAVVQSDDGSYNALVTDTDAYLVSRKFRLIKT